jgi:cytochrome c556
MRQEGQMLIETARMRASRFAVGLLLGAVAMSCGRTDDKASQTQLTVRSAPGAIADQGATADADKRTAITVDAATRVVVLTEMRTMLKGVQGIVIGAANRDTALIRASALKAGMRAASETNPAIQEQLRGDFVQMGMRTHAAFDILAADVAQGNQDMILRRLATIMGNCVGCHEQWRLTVSK